MNTAGEWVHVSERLPVADETEQDEDYESIAVPVWRGLSSVRMARVVLATAWLDKGDWYDEDGNSIDVEWWLDLVSPPKDAP